MRKLKADEIECRVAQVTAKGCSLLLYKTARVDRAILDEEFGQMNWQNDFKIINNKMYGGIGVKDQNSHEWIWKWDAGTESNTEAIKGEASDCFKRAGFKWGIGVELYSAPFVFINGTSIKDEFTSKKAGKDVYKLKDKYLKYEVFEIGYSDKGDINKLIIKDNNGNKVYELGKPIKQQETKKEEPFIPDVIKAKETGKDDIEILEGVVNCNTEDECTDYWNKWVGKLSGAEVRKQLAELLKQRREKINE